jgi:uncharacterized radical SAM superfamily protein
MYSASCISVKEKTMTDDTVPAADRALFQAAWHTTRTHFGTDFTFYLPGMIRYGRRRGRYAAISITGDQCRLLCEHCRGLLLEPMLKVTSPEQLLKKCRGLKQSGNTGILLSGGADREGRLPWRRYVETIRKIKQETGLFISAHVGFPDLDTCRELKAAGLNQALIDVIGDDDTATQVYHLEGLARVTDSLRNIVQSGLELVPHIVAGLHYGAQRGEVQALELIRGLPLAGLVVVALSPLKGTPMADAPPPSAMAVARLMAKARVKLPKTPIALGCERPRNQEGRLLERLALRAGATRMAVWSEDAVRAAREFGLDPRFQPTCCSVDYRADFGASPGLTTFI